MKNKGITLIALIITIIIMLILVAVTVSYTVKSGLIGKTTEARAKYEEETINEIVGASIVYKVTATTIKNTQYIDIPKTSVQIYKNLTANGFTILSETEEIDGGTGIKLTSDKIDLKVQGKYAEYEGEIGATGITKKVAKVEKNDNKNKDNSRPTFKLNDFKEVCSLDKAGNICVPISNFISTCNLQQDIKTSKYYTGIPDDAFIVQSDDKLGIHSGFSEYLEIDAAEIFGIEISLEGNYSIEMFLNEEDEPSEICIALYDQNHKCAGLIGEFDDYEFENDFYEKYGAIEFYLTDATVVREKVEEMRNNAKEDEK